MKTDVQIQEFNKVPDYNGYTNKPTWAVSLWINNEQGTQEHVLEMAHYAHGDKYKLSQDLQEMFTELEYPLEEASVYMDLLNWALAYVDWDELAEHFIEAAKEIET